MSQQLHILEYKGFTCYYYLMDMSVGIFRDDERVSFLKPSDGSLYDFNWREKAKACVDAIIIDEQMQEYEY